MSENKKEQEQPRQEDSLEKEEAQNKQITEMGQVVLNKNLRKHKVELLTVIGEVEGHESSPSQSKTTKYEHVLPKLAMIEDDEAIEGLLILLNTVGGDVEAGLAIAEMIASLSVPTVSLVLGGGHSIGVPMAVSADYSFIGDPSGSQQWYVYWCCTDISQYGKNPGPHYDFCVTAFTYFQEET